jgi:TldD protein
MKDLARMAVELAVGLGASYADARIVSYRSQRITTEDMRVSGISDSEDMGIGIRVIVDGAWGFSSTYRLEREAVESTVRRAIEVAKASGLAKRKPVSLVDEPPKDIRFVSPFRIDPFSIGIEQKVGLLLQVNEILLKHKGIKKATGYMFFGKEHRIIATSDGSILESEVLTSATGYTATAVREGDAKTRTYSPPPRTAGYEVVLDSDLLGNADRVAEQAMEKVMAPECEPGIKDLILDPLNLALTIHESVGHATELDRALGMEESLAGRSFATPDLLGKLRYGSEIVNFVADNTLPGGLATKGFDDDGVEGQRWFIVKDGIFSGYSTSREVAGEIGLKRSTGCCRADHWSSIPIVRQPNLSLMPGEEPLSLDDLISDTDDGIYIEGMGSFSIDQMRVNFQFGGDAFWEIKKGKRTRMLKNVIYQARTTDFWNSCDAICDERFWVPNGVLSCGKGDPMQISQMTHGAAPARFRRINVIRGS